MYATLPLAQQLINSLKFRKVIGQNETLELNTILCYIELLWLNHIHYLQIYL